MEAKVRRGRGGRWSANSGSVRSARRTRVVSPRGIRYLIILAVGLTRRHLVRVAHLDAYRGGAVQRADSCRTGDLSGSIEAERAALDALESSRHFRKGCRYHRDIQYAMGPSASQQTMAGRSTKS